MAFARYDMEAGYLIVSLNSGLNKKLPRLCRVNTPFEPKQKVGALLLVSGFLPPEGLIADMLTTNEKKLPG